MSTVKAIDTLYNGLYFRSRLEAKWAVFFDVAGMQYRYEPEGYDLGEHGYYLPDFFLPNVVLRRGQGNDIPGMFIEVKPGYSDENNEKYRALSAGTGHPVILVCGLPFIEDVRYPYGVSADEGGIYEISHDCWDCDMVFQGDVGRYSVEYSEGNYDQGIGDWLIRAVAESRKSRFEHRQTPYLK